MLALKFTIPGIPQGKGRARISTRGKFVHSYTPEKTSNYEALIKMCFTEAYPGHTSLEVECQHLRAENLRLETENARYRRIFKGENLLQTKGDSRCL